MVKQIQFLKINWFKNDDDKGGAQNEALKIKKCNEILVHSQTQKNGRMWGCMQSETLLNMLQKNYGLYEVISHYPHKIYFDIDCKVQQKYTTKEFDTFISSTLTHLNPFFPNADYAISGSCTESKVSLHIILQNYVIHNEREKEQLKHIVKYIHKSCEFYDWKVYTKNRNMKCINQSKDDGRIQEIITNNDYKAHLITCFLPDYALPFIANIPEEIKEIIEIDKAKKTFDLAELPKMNLKISSDIDFYDLTPSQILNLLPIGKSFNHSYTHLIARFCHYNGLSFETFWKWIEPKHIEKKKDLLSEKARWIFQFKNLHKFPEVSSDKIKNILCHYYPNLKKDIHYRRFCDSFNFDTSLIRKIQTISQTEFNTPEKYAIFNIGMGGGKTFQTAEFLKNNLPFCWIAPNRALAHNTYNRLEEANINISHYDKFKTKDKKNGCLKDETNLIIVANSLHYLQDKTYDILVIDEIETLIDKWFGNFMQNKKENWNVFLNIIRNAKKVILLDAFITTKTLNLINAIEQDKKMVIFERIHEPTTRTINYIADFEKMIKDIIEDLKNGLKLFIFYPYKNQSRMYENVISMENLYKMLTEKTNTEGIFYNADIDDKIKVGLKNVNSAWGNKKFIITNSIITCGVNYEKEDFDKEYLFISSFSIPRDIIQVSYRPRFLSSGIINVSYVGKMNQINTWESDTHIMNCSIYEQMTRDILIEKKTPLKKTFQLFCNKAHYSQVTDKNKINEQLQKEITDMLLNYGNGFNYLGIPDIDFSYEEIIQEKLFSGEATMLEKFMLQKYFFKKQFTDESQNVMLRDTEINALEEAWNSQYLFFFNQIRRDLANKNSIFKKIQAFNKQDKIFFDDIKKIKLNDDILQQVFIEFKFKYVSKTSGTKLLLREIYNSYFGSIIKTTYDENKNVSYIVDEYANFWYDFVTKYNKEQFIETEKGQDCDFD
jgi:hypothetical protein